MGGEEAILRADAGRESELGDAVRNDVEIADFLGALAEDLEEAGVIDAVVIVMARMNVERGLGHGAATHVEHIGEALADGGIERLMHVGDALARGEVGGAQTGHGKAGGDGRGGMFAFGFNEDQGAIRDIDMPFCRFFGPVFAHLRGGRDGVGSGRVSRFAFAHDDGGIAVHGLADSRIGERARGHRLARKECHYRFTWTLSFLKLRQLVVAPMPRGAEICG